MTSLQLANLLNVQHELVRDAAGGLFSRTKGTFTHEQAMSIRKQLVAWGKLAK